MRCEGITGYQRDEWGFTPIRCHQTVGVALWMDRDGFAHVTCAAHGKIARAKYGTRNAATTPQPRRHRADLSPWFRTGLGEKGKASLADALEYGDVSGERSAHLYRVVVNLPGGEVISAKAPTAAEAVARVLVLLRQKVPA
jgi:hypothetical protein